MKTIALKIVGSDSDLIEIDIKPDVTALDILKHAGLEESHLLSKSEPPQKYFQREEAVYDQVRDGEKLYASTPACELY